MTISTNKTGFKKITYSLTALPLIAYLKLEGFASEGISWETIEPTNTRLGADGLAAVNQKPVLYTGTFQLLPNSNSRTMLDLLVQNTTATWGKDLVDYTLVLTATNKTTRIKTIYSGGTIEQADGGDNADLDNGQENKSYRVTFTRRLQQPA